MTSRTLMVRSMLRHYWLTKSLISTMISANMPENGLSKKPKMTILITGGAGALGCTIVKRYLSEGHRVICVDSLLKTRTTENIDEFLGSKNFKFIKQDIINPLDLGSEKIDWIFNAACPVSCVTLQVDPIHTVKSCTVGLINMLELARKHHAKLLQCSSADIYGEMKDHPFRETDFGSTNTLSPRACYEEGKRIAETICMDFHRKYGVEVKIARIFNTAGPHTQMNDGRIPSVFIYNALAKRPIRIYGDGSQTRCFLHVDDQVDGLDRFMRTPADVTGPVNIGSETEVTILDLAKKILEKTQSSSEIIFERKDDAPLFRRPDITLAKQLLNWQPTRPLDVLLDDMVAAYRKKGLPESKVLVFSVTYDPAPIGPAERAFKHLAEQMPDTEFHVITSRFQRGAPSQDRFGNVFVYRVGFGTKFDKFLLPFLGARKAKSLQRTIRFRFMWSIMASYGGLLAMVLKFTGSKSSLLLVRDNAERYRGLRKRLAEFVERRSDRIINEADRSEDGPFIAQVRTMYAELTAKQEGKLDRPI